MIQHIFLHGINLLDVRLNSAHEEWLTKWLHEQESNLEAGCVSSSICLTGLMTEILLKNKPQWDWLGIVKKYLTSSEGLPLAYSEAFGKRLYKFEQQWQQTTIHAIHTRWFIERLYKQPDAHETYGLLIQGFRQPDGWFYNPSVSATRKATRMKSEYLMSFAMGIEILISAGYLSEHADRLKATISSEPLTPYLSSEYFRVLSLEFLDALCLKPVEIHTVLSNTEVGQGYCDFLVEEKRDDYMGTAKRSSRDVARHSAIASFQAGKIASYCEESVQQSVQKRLNTFSEYLKRSPLDIPPFKIRDLVGIPFGPGLTPLEIITASVLLSVYG